MRSELKERLDRVEKITSTHNQWVKRVKQLRRAKVRRQTQEYVIEGWHLVQEALMNEAEIVAVFYTEDYQEELEQYPIQTRFLISSEVSAAMGETPTPQGVIAIAKMISYPDLAEIKGSLLLLDRVQDPGNVGTMIRTADAAGYQAVVLNQGSADIYNGKVLRSMQGSQYHLPIYYRDFATFLPELKQQGVSIYGTELNEEAIDYRALQPQAPFAVIMGNEGQGVSQELLDQTTQNVYLPMRGQAESLNVAVATGILLFRWLP